MESKIYLGKYEYWHNIVHVNDLMKNKSFPFNASLEKNGEFHESIGLRYLCDVYNPVFFDSKTSRHKIQYMFKIVDKHKYMLARIRYGF